MDIYKGYWNRDENSTQNLAYMEFISQLSVKWQLQYMAGLKILKLIQSARILVTGHSNNLLLWKRSFICSFYGFLNSIHIDIDSQASGLLTQGYKQPYNIKHWHNFEAINLKKHSEQSQNLGLLISSIQVMKFNCLAFYFFTKVYISGVQPWFFYSIYRLQFSYPVFGNMKNKNPFKLS